MLIILGQRGVMDNGSFNQTKLGKVIIINFIEAYHLFSFFFSISLLLSSIFFFLSRKRLEKVNRRIWSFNKKGKRRESNGQEGGYLFSCLEEVYLFPFIYLSSWKREEGTIFGYFHFFWYNSLEKRRKTKNTSFLYHVHDLKGINFLKLIIYLHLCLISCNHLRVGRQLLVMINV